MEFFLNPLKNIEEVRNRQEAIIYLSETDLEFPFDIKFTYQLVSGVAEEKLGMWLLQREKIFEILKSIVPNQG